MRRVNLRLIFCAIGLSLAGIFVIFLLIHSSGSTLLKELHSVKCNCPLTQDRPSKIIPTTSTVIPNAVISTTCTEVEKSSPVQRAIIIYYSHYQREYFFPEVKWLYRSWMEMLQFQPATWRTDFVIFTYNFTTEFRRLGCVNRLRQDTKERSMCRLFLYVPIKFRTQNITENHFQHAFDDAKRVMASYDEMNDSFIGVPIVSDTKTFDAKRSESLFTNLQTYEYTDSINMMYEGYPTFKMYDFVLRTDIDVFIYRHFGNYIPQNCTFITGGGGYGTHYNRRKLGRIANDMGLSYANISGMGSTWYGTPYDSYLVANQTLHGMLWLAQYEFAPPERESKLGVLLWPDWHYGVLLLYGQHLGLNHLAAIKQVRLVVGHNLLDQSSTDTSTDYFQKGIRLNLHCWHTDERFSKFAFKMGRYNQTDLEKYRNDTTAQAYAMRMALESKYMTLEELVALGRNTSSSSSS